MQFHLYLTAIYTFIVAAISLASSTPLDGALENVLEARETRSKANEYKSTDWLVNL